MAFNLNNLKDLFGSLKEKGAEVTAAAADKAKDAARIAKLTVDLNTEKENLKKAYLELGKAYFEENKDSAEGLFAQLCEEVSAVAGRIDAMQDELDGLKNGFKPAPAPDFESVVAAAEEDADVTVEITEEPCEACEKESCDGCDVAEAKKEGCCEEPAKEDEACCCEEPAKEDEACCCEEPAKEDEACCCEEPAKEE